MTSCYRKTKRNRGKPYTWHRCMNEDFKITQFIGKRKEIEVSHIPGTFVKVEHIESGITVTKYAKYAIDALKEAQEECNKLVEIYNKRGGY